MWASMLLFGRNERDDRNDQLETSFMGFGLDYQPLFDRERSPRSDRTREGSGYQAYIIITSENYKLGSHVSFHISLNNICGLL